MKPQQTFLFLILVGIALCLESCFTRIGYKIGANIDTVRVFHSSTAVTRRQLLAMIDENALPIHTKLNFKNSDGIFSLTNSDIQNAAVIKSNRATVIWTTIGAIADIVCTVFIVESI